MTDKQREDFRLSRTVRDILRRIDTIFAAGGKAAMDGQHHKSRSARQLWDILSALRGPDSEDMAAKRATTMVIRAASFPKTFGKGNSFVSIPASFGYDGSDNVPLRQGMIGYRHFEGHARKAFDVLGLEWRQLNPDAQVDIAAVPKRKTSKKSKTKSARR